MAFHVIIPARMHSTRLPNKPLLDIAGLPMIIRVARQAAQSNATEVTVATDHPDIAEVCRAHGVSVIMTRPDHDSGSTRLAEVVEQLQLDPQTVVVNVQGDEPLIDPQLIQALARHLEQCQAPMATVAAPIVVAADLWNPNVVKLVLNARHEAMMFSRSPLPYARDAFARDRMHLPADALFLRHIGLYAYRAQFLLDYAQLAPSPLEQLESLEQLRVLYHGHAIGVYQTALTVHAGVDTLEDLERVCTALQPHDDGTKPTA